MSVETELDVSCPRLFIKHKAVRLHKNVSMLYFIHHYVLIYIMLVTEILKEKIINV
jgi:hypothetical protein